MDSLDVHELYCTQSGEMLLDDVIVHPLGIVGCTCIIYEFPGTCIINEKDIGVTNEVTRFHLRLHLGNLTFQITTAFGAAKRNPVLMTALGISTVPDFCLVVSV